MALLPYVQDEIDFLISRIDLLMRLKLTSNRVIPRVIFKDKIQWIWKPT